MGLSASFEHSADYRRRASRVGQQGGALKKLTGVVWVDQLRAVPVALANTHSGSRCVV